MYLIVRNLTCKLTFFEVKYMKIFTYDNHTRFSSGFFDCFMINGRLSLDDCFQDINNSELDQLGARYFWSDYTTNNFVDGFILADNRLFQLCGVSVEGSVSLLVVVITKVCGLKSKLDVMFQIEFESKMFMDVSITKEVFDELLEYIVIPFYSTKDENELKLITMRLYYAIQYEFVRLELNDIDPKIIQFLKHFDPKTLERLHFSE
jgi:hypothetical protein